MIPGGDPYGWGVFSVPMPHEVRPADPAGMPLYRLLTRDIPWRTVLFSVVMTCLVFAWLLLFGRSEPTPLVREEPPPLELTVMLRPEVREMPPPAVLPPPAPSRPQPPPPATPVVRQTPPPPAPPVVREPPKPPPVVREAPKPPPEPQLPQPTQLVRQPQRQAPAAAALPQRKTEVAVQTEPVLPTAPSLDSYKQNPRTASTAELPQPSSTAFRTENPATDLAVQPAPGRQSERASAPAALPKSVSASFGSPSEVAVDPLDTSLSQKRVANPSAGSALPAATRSQTVTAGRSGDTAVVAPQTSGVRSDLGARSSETAVPAQRQTVAISGGGGEQNLSGPASTARVAASAAPAAALPTGGSFDFLDTVSPAELDRSVLVSLNRLRTCRDPEAEIRLKTRLASLLTQPSTCRSGGVVFAMRNPESAYSIHIDLYNYEGKEFRDRCEALDMAVRCCEARR